MIQLANEDMWPERMHGIPSWPDHSPEELRLKLCRNTEHTATTDGIRPSCSSWVARSAIQLDVNVTDAYRSV